MRLVMVPLPMSSSPVINVVYVWFWSSSGDLHKLREFFFQGRRTIKRKEIVVVAPISQSPTSNNPSRLKSGQVLFFACLIASFGPS